MSKLGGTLAAVMGLTASLALARFGEGTGVEPIAEAAEGPLRVVVHVNFADVKRQAGGLKNVANILKEAPDALVEVVCHSDGIAVVTADRSEHAGAVADLAARGVRFAACRNTMRERSIAEEDLLPGVETVPSGAVEVARKQQIDGYAYFKP
ncbi:DsrE family protein [Tautonia sociabilis]|nr:DsrE family protein [Tautonia sociabilis]